MQFLIGHTQDVPKLVFSPDGTRLASIDKYGRISLWRFPAGELETELGGPSYDLLHVAFSPDGQWLATAAAPYSAAVDVRHFSDIQRKRPLRYSLQGNPSMALLAFAFTPDNRYLDFVARRGVGWMGTRFQEYHIQVQRWEVGTWYNVAQQLLDIRESSYRPMTMLDPTNTLLAIGTYRQVLGWDWQAGKEVFRITDPSLGEPTQMAFGAGGRLLATSRNRRISVIDVRGKRMIASWRNPTTKHIQSIAFTPDGRTLATVSNDTYVRFWDPTTGRETKTYAWDLGQLKSVTIAPDGMRAATSGKKGEIIVWDLD